MKKLVAFMLCCMMMVGTLSAFASDDVMPLGECDHNYGTYTNAVTERIGTCTVLKYNEVICSYCDEVLRHSNVKYTYSHNWVTDIIDGEEVEICTKCDEIK